VIPGLVRLSVGIENVTDIIDDLSRAFEKVKHFAGKTKNPENRLA
jgi:hypothetical protein